VTVSTVALRSRSVGRRTSGARVCELLAVNCPLFFLHNKSGSYTLAVHAFIRNFVAYILTRPLHLLIYTWCRAANHRRLLRDHHRAFKFIVTDFDFFNGFGEAEAPPPASA
jgi:hypothetical protein